MRVGLLQRNFGVGAFESNVAKIREGYLSLAKQGADVVIAPEQAIGGYPAHDLVERPEFLEKDERALFDLADLTKGHDAALLVGHVLRNPAPQGRRVFNHATVLRAGKVEFQQAKSLLPTYDVFDEARYFEPARDVRLWHFKGKKIAIAICEDLWGGTRYLSDPTRIYSEQGANLVLGISASPYEFSKARKREAVHAEVARRLRVPLAYVNGWGATDELMFDGQSFAMAADGHITHRLQSFADDEAVFEVGQASREIRSQEAPVEYDLLHRGLVCGIRDYFSKTGFSKAVIGLSGGMDSALVARLAVEALGAKGVLGVAMPGPYSSAHSLEDAEQLARSLGCAFEVRPIKFVYSTLQRELGAEGLAQENLQARLRGLVLMTRANQLGALVLNTSNKSESAMGYSTQYGDLIGALSPIGDLTKTRVYELAHHLNTGSALKIPDRTLTKAPSAELRPHQTDQDSLPPYPELDAVLEAYLEEGWSESELRQKLRFAWLGEDDAAVHRFVQRIERAEFKRRQAPPVLKVTSRAFGPGRRMPIAKEW